MGPDTGNLAWPMPRLWPSSVGITLRNLAECNPNHPVPPLFVAVTEHVTPTAGPPAG